MAIPRSGVSRFMREGAAVRFKNLLQNLLPSLQSYKGIDEAVIRNIEACAELAGQIRSAYGPQGMNKMVINHIEKMFVTSDAATILNELEVQHPAARMLVMAAQQQEAQIGDNTNTVLIFAAALLENAAELIQMVRVMPRADCLFTNWLFLQGLKPVEIANGYKAAYEHAARILGELVVSTFTSLDDEAAVKRVLRASIMSKQYDHYDLIAALVAEACVQTVPRAAAAFNVDNVRIVKILGAGVGASHVMNGMVFKRGVEGDRKSVSSARVAVFACPFDLTQTETKVFWRISLLVNVCILQGTVLMNTADDLLQFSKSEESEVEAQVKALAERGINVVVAAGKFGDIYVHYLNVHNIMGVRLVSKFDMRRLCRTIGAQAQARIVSAERRDHLHARQMKCVFADGAACRSARRVQ